MEKDITQIILSTLQTSPSIPDSFEFASKQGIDHLVFVGHLKSLDSFQYVELNQLEKQKFILTNEGSDYVLNGTPEYRLFHLIPAEGIEKDVLKKSHDSLFAFGFQNGMKNKWFQLEKTLLKKSTQNIEDKDKLILIDIQNGKEPTKEIADIMKKRKLIEKSVLKYYEVKKGPSYRPVFEAATTELTGAMIKSGSWKGLAFKPYNFKALGKEIPVGNLNPLLKVKSQFREVLLEMGFEEMPTNNFVDTSFWNFECLFIPQSHPARDIQDTFFVSDPKEGKKTHEEYWARVKKMHEEGGEGSIGWRYEWSEKEAHKNIFRTHTTDASARMLFKMGQEKEFKPRKFFSIDRVFRNENLDATHLAEFHQIEGVVAGKNIGLAHLKGILKEFYSKIGINQLWFKPTYNPYTEPSMEIYGYHPILKRKVEIGNSGVFRPEMLLPMGLPKDVSVIAWGLSLERPTMIQYSVANIRDLIGPKLSVKYLRENPICCLKEAEKKEKELI